MMSDMRFAQSIPDSVPSPVDVFGKFHLEDVDLQDVALDVVLCSLPWFGGSKDLDVFFFFF